MSLYLTLMRENNHNVWTPYKLAASSAKKRQTELTERYLQLSAKRGLWSYYNLLKDDSFTNIEHSATYRSILAATKAVIYSTRISLRVKLATHPAYRYSATRRLANGDFPARPLQSRHH